MVWIRVEVAGDADEVARVLGHLGGATVRVADGERISTMGQDRWETNPVLEPSAEEISPAPLSSGWTEELAADFTASLDAVARRMTLHVWRAGAAGIHRSALCQRTDADGPRAAAVPAGTGDDAVPAGGGQQPAAELLRRSRLRRGGGVVDVWREDGGPAGRRCGRP